VKTTIELPDPIFRHAKAAAAERGQSLKDFFTEAVEARLRRQSGPGTGAKPWEKAFGALEDLHLENRRVERVIAAEFETVD
jgi:hypothetical protein